MSGERIPDLLIDEKGEPYVLLGGKLRVYLVTPDEAQAADIVVCSPVSFFSDDVRARCQCGATMYHRPTVPTRPPKVCLHCAIAGAPGARRKKADL